MDKKELFTILLSSTVVSTLITTLLNALTNRRKDEIENITKERKNWRDELRVIAEEISKASNINEFELAITKLKVRINTYGVADNSIFSDSQLWMHFHFFEKHEKPLINNLKYNILDNYKYLFINQISCLLKYDWERSKSEIKGNLQNKFVSGALIISFLFYSLRWFLRYEYTTETLEDFISFCVAFSIYSIYALLVIAWADKWKSKIQWQCYLCLCIVGFVFIVVLFYLLVSELISNELIDWIILSVPVLTLLYGSEIKILNYRRNARRLIISSTILSGSKIIDNKYKIFFGKRTHTNIVTNNEITFTD